MATMPTFKWDLPRMASTGRFFTPHCASRTKGLDLACLQLGNPKTQLVGSGSKTSE